MGFTAIIYSLNKASRIHSTTVKHSFGSRGTFPNLVFVVRHEVRSHEFMHEYRCWYFTQSSYQFGIHI